MKRWLFLLFTMTIVFGNLPAANGMEVVETVAYELQIDSEPISDCGEDADFESDFESDFDDFMITESLLTFSDIKRVSHGNWDEHSEPFLDNKDKPPQV